VRHLRDFLDFHLFSPLSVINSLWSPSPDWCLWVVQRTLWRSDFGCSAWVPGRILLPGSKGLYSRHPRLRSGSYSSNHPLSSFLDSTRTLLRYWQYPLPHWPERTDFGTAIQSRPMIEWEKRQSLLPGERGFQTTLQPFHSWKKRESRGFFPHCNWTTLGPNANTVYRSWRKLDQNFIRQRSLGEREVLALLTV